MGVGQTIVLAVAEVSREMYELVPEGMIEQHISDQRGMGVNGLRSGFLKFYDEKMRLRYG